MELTAYTDHEAVMSVDGHTPVPLLDGDEVRVEASDRTVRFVRFQDPGYFYRNITAYMEQNPSAGNPLMIEATPTATRYCYSHPNRETDAALHRCERPICSECAVLTPTGYRCKECIRGQQKVFDTA